MRKTVTLLISMFYFSSVAYAQEFSFTFEWGNIPKCTSGNPNRVSNPIFTLKNVPDGTVLIKFNMKDRDAPSYYHGGGKAEYNGQNVIEAGKFKYKSPCPPSGSHLYEWKAVAKDADGNTIGKARAKKRYPE